MIALLLLLACGSTEAPTASEAPEAPEAASGSAVDAVLAKADEHDGAVDTIVHECTGCGLGMLGDPTNATQHAGYTLHFCSEGCLHSFEEDPEAGVERLAGFVD
jgi:hypothetical protein